MNIIEGLVLAAIVALVGSSLYQAKSMVELQTTVVYMRGDMVGLRSSLADMQALSLRVTRVEVKQEAILDEVKDIHGNKGLK